MRRGRGRMCVFVFLFLFNVPLLSLFLAVRFVMGFMGMYYSSSVSSELHPLRLLLFLFSSSSSLPLVPLSHIPSSHPLSLPIIPSSHPLSLPIIPSS